MEKEQSNFEKKLTQIRESKFWDAFRFTKNGKVKSTLIIYSFSLSFLFIAIYVAAYWLLIDVLEFGLKDYLSTQPLILVESFVPALLGSLVCCAFHFLFTDKKMVLFTYGWIILFAIVIAAAAGAVFTSQEMGILWVLALRFAVPPIGVGVILAAALYVGHKRNDPLKKYEALPDWKKNR